MKTRNDKGFTLIELLIVVAIIGIIAAIAIPGLLRARMSGNESSAIGSLRAVNTAQVAFSSACANNFYSQSLDTLAKPPTGGSQAFISTDLGTDGVAKSGYVITVDLGVPGATNAGPACNGNTDLGTTYYASAIPSTFGTTGNRSFATNTSGTIFQSTTATAPTNTVPVTGGTPIQ